MSTRGRWVRWFIGPVLAAVLISTPYAIASAIPTLPHKAAAQILALITSSTRVTGLTGMIQQQSNLGLPDLGSSFGGTAAPTTGSSGDTTSTLSQTLTLLGSNQRARIAINNHTGIRFQLYKPEGEQDLVLTNGNFWSWDYQTHSVTHAELPQITATWERRITAVTNELGQGLVTVTPQQASEAFITTLAGHTSTRVGRNQYVAGRAAYTLMFVPRESATLVASIQIAVDAQTGLPLQFAIYAKNQADPAYLLRYTSIDYHMPAADTFAFTPPPHAKVKTVNYTIPALAAPFTKTSGNGKSTTTSGTATSILGIVGGGLTLAQHIRVTGSGWASAFTLPAGSVKLTGNKLLTTLSNPLPHGARAVSTSLLNIVFNSDGSVTFGAVPLTTLEKR